MGFGVGLLHRRREAAGGEDTSDGRSHGGPLPPCCLSPTTPSPQSVPTSPSSCRRWGRWGGGRPAARRASPAPLPAAPSCTGRGGFTIHPLHSRSPPTAPGPGTASPRGFAFQCGRTAPTPARAAAKGKLRHGRSQPHLRIPGHPGDTSQHRRLAPPTLRDAAGGYPGCRGVFGTAVPGAGPTPRGPVSTRSVFIPSCVSWIRCFLAQHSKGPALPGRLRERGQPGGRGGGQHGPKHRPRARSAVFTGSH